jgi:hypothetical protein
MVCMMRGELGGARPLHLADSWGSHVRNAATRDWRTAGALHSPEGRVWSGRTRAGWLGTSLG